MMLYSDVEWQFSPKEAIVFERHYLYKFFNYSSTIDNGLNHQKFTELIVHGVCVEFDFFFFCK
jgi:hypothetical protein